jgi:uncharacterized lipoprotein YddW (UPF0748 family)
MDGHPALMILMGKKIGLPVIIAITKKAVISYILMIFLLLIFSCATESFRQPVVLAENKNADRPATLHEKNEMRAAWVVAFRQMTSPEKIDRVISWAKRARINTLFVQVRASGNAYYKSKLVPRSEELEGQPDTFDPLAYMIRAGKNEGIKIHAYFNLGILWRNKIPPRSPKHIINAHPDWIMKDSSGKFAYPRSDDPQGSVVENYYWVDWSNPALRRHCADVIDEVVRTYDIDGVHLDFVRYPARMGRNVSYAGYNENSVDQFVKTTGTRPEEHHKLWDDWRTRHIGESIRLIHDRIAMRGKKIPLSAAVLAEGDIARARNYTDYREWIRKGYLDFAVLMSYFDSMDEIRKSVFNAKETIASDRFVLGVNIGKHPSDAIASQIDLSREENFKGFALFSLDEEGMNNLDGYLGQLRSDIPDINDTRYLSTNPVWTRVAIVDSVRPTFSSRFYSRRGNTTLIVYPRNLTSLSISINGKNITTIRCQGYEPVEFNLSEYVKPEERVDAASHDFSISVTAKGSGFFRAEIFTVDYYSE